MEVQRDRIANENAAAAKAPWAGNFYNGDGTGTNVRLSLAPHAGVAATSRGCMGTYAANKGAVIPQADGSLLLKYEQPNDERGIGFADHVVPVAWGERMYLIPEKQLAEFASAVNLGDEPRTSAFGLFLMREGDEQRQASGLPALPPEAKRLIQQAPLAVGVISATRLPDKDPDHFICRYRLELDHGAKAGLAAGMELTTTNVRGGNRVILDQTTPTRAIGTMYLYGDDCTDSTQRPSAKTRFTTGAYQAAQPKRSP
ncbi:hypothetical protein [Dyella silvae]|uniref:hypothetical protein n=1 Tax=Dyella silvae TaxID=2994424 RepID=UPI0022641DF9|nr:hypothetical protein [Dyella silvae]